MSHDVFISFSSDDVTVADATGRALESAGIRCWRTPHEVPPGSPSSPEHTRAIQESRALVLIFSERSNNSADVRREVEIAADSRRPIVQFRIDAVAPGGDLEVWLRGSQQVDAITSPLENHFDELTSSVSALLAGPPLVSPAPVPGGEPTSALPPTNLWRFVGGPFAALAHFGSDRERVIALVLLGSVAAVFSLSLLRPHRTTTAPPVRAPSVPSQSSPATPAVAPRMSVAPPSNSSVVSTEEAGVYVRELSRALEQGDLAAIIARLGDPVDYSTFGPKEKSFLAQQLRQYFAAFPVRVFAVNDVKVQPGPQPDVASVICSVEFSTRDTSGHTNAGRAHVEIDLVRRSDGLKITRTNWMTNADETLSP